MRFRFYAITALIFIFLWTACLYSTAAGTTYVWNPTSGTRWYTPANWLVDGVTATDYPTNLGDTAILNGATVASPIGYTLDCDIFFENVTMSGGGSGITFRNGDIHQNGGSVSFGGASFRLGIEAGNVASYDVNNGRLINTGNFYVGYNYGTATMTIRGDDAYVSTGPMSIGREDSNATLTIYGGTLSGASLVLGSSNTGDVVPARSELNIEAGDVSFSGTTYIGQSTGTGYSTGTVNQSGGTFTTSGTLYVGYGRSDGFVNLSGGTFTATGISYIGPGTSAGEGSVLDITDTGEAFFAELTIGHNAGGKGQAFMSGKTLSAETLYLGRSSGTGELMLSSGDVTVAGNAIIGSNGGHATIIQTGGTFSTDTLQFYASSGTTYDIYDGVLDVTATLSTASNARGGLRIHGTSPTVTAGTLTTSANNFALGFYVESTLVSMLQVSGTATLAGTHEIAPMSGFSIISDDSFGVIRAGSVTGTFNVQAHCPFTSAVVPDGGSGGQEVRVTFADDHAYMGRWDDYNTKYYTQGELSGAEKGWIRMANPGEDAYAGVIATFRDAYSPDGGMTGETAAALLEHLNGTMAGSGAVFQRYGVDTYTIVGDFFTGNDHAYFGWDLTAFNEIHGTGIYLYSLEVPEPATWLMMLAGLSLAVIPFRRKNRRHPRGSGCP